MPRRGFVDAPADARRLPALELERDQAGQRLERLAIGLQDSQIRVSGGVGMPSSRLHGREQQQRLW